MNMETAGERQAKPYKNARNLRGILLCKKQRIGIINTVEKPRKINTNRQNEINKSKSKFACENLKHDDGS